MINLLKFKHKKSFQKEDLLHISIKATKRRIALGQLFYFFFISKGLQLFLFLFSHLVNILDYKVKITFLNSVYLIEPLHMCILCFLVFLLIIGQTLTFYFLVYYNKRRMEQLNSRSLWSKFYSLSTKFQLVANITILRVFFLLNWKFQ